MSGLPAVAEITVHELDVMGGAEWTFRDSAPRWAWRDYRAIATFDPFPAYPHHVDDVVEAAGLVQDCWTPAWNVELFVANREEVGRSNGFSYVQHGNSRDDVPTGMILLSGKRVPPHPAVTRYLVAHEYGHNVQWMIARFKGYSSLWDETWLAEYAKVRGLGPENMHHGSGGRWHDAIGEILACDFRILICDVEPGYWPHPGIPHPATVDGLNWWWQELADEVGDWVASETAVPGSAQVPGTTRRS